jgi:hypothetical protein
MDLPPRLPLPSQVTIEVLPAIDLNERFGADPDEDEVYEEITSLMQDALDDLADERDLPLVGPVWSDRDGDRDGDEADDSRDDGDEPTSEDGDEAETIEDRGDGDGATSEDGELEDSPWRVPARGLEAVDDEGVTAADGSATPADLGPPADEPSAPDAPIVPEVAAEASSAAEAANGGGPPDMASPPEPSDVDETAVSPAATFPAASAAPTAAADVSRAAPVAPTTPTAAPEDPSVAAPADQEPSTLVAEFAEPGAEDGAGAELRVDEPWTGYASMKVADISDRLSAASSEALLAVRLYEATHKNRSGVLRAVERELKRR